MNKSVEEYLSHLMASNRSLELQKSSERAINQLTLFLHETYLIKDWREVSELHLRSFVLFAATRYKTAQDRQIKHSTLRQWLARIRRFFSWLNKSARLLHNPSERLLLPQKQESLPHVLNETEIALLIEQPDITKATGLRDRAIMELLYATGLRHREAYRLDIYDVDTSARRLTVRCGKGSKDRIAFNRKRQLLALALHHILKNRTQRSEMVGKRQSKKEKKNDSHKRSLAFCHRQTPFVSNDSRPHYSLCKTSRTESKRPHLPPFVRYSLTPARRKHPSHPSPARTLEPRINGNLHTSRPCRLKTRSRESNRRTKPGNKTVVIKRSQQMG